MTAPEDPIVRCLLLPETKGKTPEEVQRMWSDPAELHRAAHARR